MNLYHALRLHPADCIAFSGAGGKTTAIFHLARDIQNQNSNRDLPVVVTATTHLQIDQALFADYHLVCTSDETLAGKLNSLKGIVLVTGPREGDRTTGVNPSILSRLHEICLAKNINLLIESDGSRKHPLKAPAEHEPVIPPYANLVVVVAGMQGIGKPLNDKFVHRMERFSNLTGLSVDDLITPESLVKYLTHSNGGLKGIPAGARRVILLNQADTLDMQSIAKEMTGRLLSAFGSVVVASMQIPCIHAVREPVAGIILAAGEAKRFGNPKQLLDWHGKPFVRHIAEIALTSNLDQVIVVSGSYRDAVEKAVGDLPLIICHNPDWGKGQSSSLIAGMRSLTAEIGGVIFLLADQPFISKAVIDALMEEHARDHSPIIAPFVQNKRANPVLFDQVTFKDLSTISGDVGGRMLFSKYPVTSLPWNDSRLLTDVDHPDDYGQLLVEP